MKIYLLFIFLLITILSSACPITINIKNKQGIPIEGVIININHNQVGHSDAKGNLTFSADEGKYLLQLLSEDYFLLLEDRITVDCKQKTLYTYSIVEDKDKLVELNEVVVQAKTKKTLIESSPLSVQVLDLKTEHRKGGDISDALGKTLGVKLRSDGNIGSPVQINLGGLQGKAVRLFKDGIPIELFGHGFSLGNIPSNMLDRVEIYKGVMPLHLASDALGGGINLVSRQDYKNTAEVSYELGSYNTHRATVYALWVDKSNKWYAGTNSSFNYSDNDYKINAPFHDKANGVTTYKKAKRFHDATRAYYIEAYAGLKNRRWADDMRLTLINSNFYKEIQHDAEMNNVYGKPFSKEKNYTALLNYRKRLFDDKLRINTFASYSHFETQFIDTATVRYGWDGQIIGQNLPKGEINLGNDQNLTYRFFTTRLHLTYQLSEMHSLDFSQLYYYQRRKGSDPLGAISAIERIDVLTVPASYSKDNTAISLTSLWLNKQLESIVALKYYHYKTQGYTTDNFGLGWRSSSSDQQLGWLGGLRWLNDNIQAKLSYEYANRLPDEHEIFGDALITKENMDLKPEKSHNINLDMQYVLRKGSRTLVLSSGLFYRKVKDIIFLQLDIPFSRYINYENSEIKGGEIEVNYTPARVLNFGANLTYQDIRRVNIKEAMFKNLEGSRIPNVPFLFGNFWLNTSLDNIFKKKDRIELSWKGNYTHRFFLKAIPKDQEPGLFEDVEDFQTSLIIPRDNRLGQWAHNLGVYYHLANQRITIAGECRNIGNTKLYDNFNVQKQGRSFYIKLVYKLK